MNLDDYFEKLNGDGTEVFEIFWQKPNRDSPDLLIRGRVPETPLDRNRGDRGFLYGLYLRLVRDVIPVYIDRNVKPPFIEVCLTKERNGAPNNVVQIPLSYIPTRPIRLEPIKHVA